MNIEWIDSRKRLPARCTTWLSTNVLVQTPDKNIRIAYYAYNAQEWFLADNEDESISVECWAYIPLSQDDMVNDLPVEDKQIPEGYYQA